MQSNGPLGLKYLAQGLSPKEVIEKLTADDSSAPRRQVGIVDADGRGIRESRRRTGRTPDK